jgi:hypothetical protein
MAKKRAPAAIHSKTADKRGRTKDRRHGTKSWTTWIEEARMHSAGRDIRSNRH